MVGSAQVLGVGRCQRVRKQIRRTTGGLGRAIHAQRPGLDLTRSPVGPQEETVEGYRGPRWKPCGPNGQRIQTRINI